MLIFFCNLAEFPILSLHSCVSSTVRRSGGAQLTAFVAAASSFLLVKTEQKLEEGGRSC